MKTNPPTKILVRNVRVLGANFVLGRVFTFRLDPKSAANEGTRAGLIDRIKDANKARPQHRNRWAPTAPLLVGNRLRLVLQPFGLDMHPSERWPVICDRGRRLIDRPVDYPRKGDLVNLLIKIHPKSDGGFSGILLCVQLVERKGLTK